MNNRSYFHILRSILNSSNAWHIQQGAAMAYMPQIINLLKGESTPTVLDNREQREQMGKENFDLFVQKYSSVSAEPFLTDRENWSYDFVPLRMGDVLMIPILEPIAQYDYCGIAGTSTIANWYDRAEKDSSIKAIVEVKNTPGGEVFGTRALAERKLAFNSPIVGLTTGLQCSAGLYIGATDDYALAETSDCIIGSCGVMTTIVDMAKYYAEQGIVIHEIYSKTSPLKNDAHRKAMNGDLKGYEEGILFNFDKSFMGFMQEHRPDISKNALSGAEFMSQDAIENGLIDEIGNFQAAYDIALQAIDNPKFLTSKKSNKSMKTVFTLNGVAEKIVNIFKADSDKKLNPESLEEVEGALKGAFKADSIEIDIEDDDDKEIVAVVETPEEANASAEAPIVNAEVAVPFNAEAYDAFEGRLKRLESAYELSLSENSTLKDDKSTLKGTITTLEGTISTLKAAIKKPVVANPTQEATDQTALSAQAKDDGMTHYQG